MRKGSGKNVSVNYVIDRNGDIYKLFDDNKISYHAGADFRKIS